MAGSQEEIITIYSAQVEGYTKEIDAIIKKVRELTGIEDQQTKNAAVGARSLTDSAAQRKKLLNDEIANLKKLQEQSKKAFTVPEIQSFNSQILQSKNNIALLGGETQKLGAITNGLKAQFTAIGPAILAGFSIVALKSFVQEASKVSAQFQSITTAINFVQGSTAKGAVAIEFLRELSERLGLELLSTAQSFKLFSASAQLGGISADETKEIFESVATATTALGLSADDAQGVFLALSQIVSKGTVAAEELRGQIGERLPGAFEIAAKSIGVSTKELNKLLEGGKVLSKDFLPAFANELRVTFSSALPNAVNNAQANFNRLKNITTESLIAVGDIVNKNFLNPLVKGLTSLTEVSISEKLEEERVRLNSLVLQITATNDNQEKRNNLVKELQDVYPDFLKNISSEGVSNETLRDRLKEVNNELLNKIVLQRAQEDINKEVEKAAELTISQSDAESELAKRITLLTQTYNDELTPAQKLAIEQQDTLIKKGEELSKSLQQQQAIQRRSGDLVTISQQGIDRLDLAISNIRNTQIKLNDANKESADLTERRNRLAKEFNITVEEGGKKLESAAKKELGLLDELKKKRTELVAAQESNRDPKLVQSFIDQIKAIDAQIDELTGKAAEDRLKKEKDLREKLIEQEKKTQDEINKLRVETEPDLQKKITIQKDIDAKLTEAVKEDLRSRAQIELAINQKKNDLLVLQNLKAFQEISKLESGRSFTEDERNLTAFVEKRTSEIINSNKLIAEKENELTALNRTEFELRLLNAQQFTGDIIEQEKLIASAKAELNKFILDQEKKIADARLKAAQELQSELDQERVIETGGGLPGLELQKTLAIEQSLRELADAKTIQDEQTKADTIAAINKKLQNDLSEIDLEISQTQIENFRKTFDAIAGFAREFVNIFAELENAKSDIIIQELEDQQESQKDSFDKQEEDLQTQLNKRLISQKQFEIESAKLKDARIVSEKKIADAIKAEQQKQAERTKALAIFQATLNFAQALIAALTIPPPASFIAEAITAALAGVQLAAVIATPVPKLAVGTKDKKESGLAIVGEQGEELVHIPSAAQVLPSPKTKKNKEIINAMFDDNLNEYISKKYVQPEIRKQKISTEKKYEILKQVYEKQAVDTYNKSVLEKYDYVKTESLNKIVNNYINKIFETKVDNLTTDKKIIDEVVNKKNELTEILNQAKILRSDSFINSETKDRVISEIKQTVTNNILYDSKFIRSINTNYVGKALEETRAAIETKKQEAFANNIANSFMMQKDVFVNNNAIDEAGMEKVLRNHRKFDQRFADYLAAKIAEESKVDPRRII